MLTAEISGVKKVRATSEKLSLKEDRKKHSKNIMVFAIALLERATTLCSEKKHPLIFSFIFP